MKKTALILIGMGIILSAPLRGQTILTANDVAAEVAQVTGTDPAPAQALSPVGIYYSAQDPDRPGVPVNPNNLPGWALPNGQFILDDLDSNVEAQFRFSGRRLADDPTSPPDGGGGSGSGGGSTNTSYPLYSFDTNSALWIEPISVDLTNLNLILHGCTNTAYAILSTSNLSTPSSNWDIECEVLPTPTGTNGVPFTVPILSRSNLFLQAMDWSYAVTGSNTVPNFWLYWYYGSNGLLFVDGTIDSRGDTLLSDYLNTNDPNPIYFSVNVTNQYFNAGGGAVQFNVSDGQPFYMAYLVDSTDTAGANWTPYSSNLVVNLGSVEGWQTVWVGLKGLPPNAQQTWMQIQLKLVLTPPTLVIMQPAAGIVTQPFIQVQGYSPQNLARISYDLSNSVAFAANQQALVTGLQFDTNSFEYTTNTFECFNVPLTIGTNIVTLHAEDLAGNAASTNVAYIYDPTANTNPPVINLSWPQSGASISGTNFPIRGTVSDPFATVTAQIVNGTATNNVAGLVEQNGSFWIENAPFGGGTNYVTITATNTAGYGTVTNIVVTPSGVPLTITSVTLNDPNAPSATVTVSFGGSGGTVLVNGVVATNNGDGTWTAYYVPTGDSGTASFSADATLDGTPRASDTQMAAAIVQSPEVTLVQYQENYSEQSPDGRSTATIIQNYVYGSAGGYAQKYCSSNFFNYYLGNWDATGNGVYEEGVTNDCGDTSGPNWEGTGLVNGYDAPGWNFNAYVNGPGYSEQFLAQSLLALKTGGQSKSGQNNIWALALYVTGLTPLDGDADATNETPLPANQFTVAGQTPDSSGNVFLSLPDGATANLPVSGSAPSIIYNFGYSKLSLISLTVISNSATQIDATNWATVKTATNNYVYVQATLNNSDPNAAANIQWSAGEAVPGQPFQRRISTTNPIETVVTATLSSKTLGLNVWVMWATIGFVTNGPNPVASLVSFTNTNNPVNYNGEELGVQYNSSSNRAEGKICIIATVTPNGLPPLLTNGWNFYQLKLTQVYANGSAVSLLSYSNWVDDGPDLPFKTITLDASNSIYSIDGPTIAPISLPTTEVYYDFYDYVTWSNQICSSTNNFWRWWARYDSSSTPHISSAILTTGFVQPPTNAFYQPE